MAGRYEILGDEEESSKWKDKYLENVESSEREERRLHEQMDLLRRGLVRVSLAADGIDDGLDVELGSLRQALRGDAVDLSLPEALVEKLEDTVLSLDKRKSQRADDFMQALMSVCDQLLESDAPKDVKKELKEYKKSLAERMEHHQEHSALIAELASLQNKSLASILSENPKAKGGIFRSLFKGSEEAKESEDNTPLAEEKVTSEPEAEESDGGIEPSDENGNTETEQSSDPDTNEEVNSAKAHQSPDYLDEEGSGDEMELETTEHIQLMAQDEEEVKTSAPVFSKVAESVVSILNNLLKQVYITERAKEYAVKAKQRLKVGLNWYELGPLLEDISKIIVYAQGDEQKELVDYLKELNEDLVEVESFLKVSRQSQDDRKQVSDALDQSMRGHVDDIEKDVREATDLGELKVQIDGQLERILSSLDEFKRSSDAVETTLSDDLQNILQRVEKMEAESKTVNAHLEEERAKALTDTLTKLPNREAYNERLKLEFARWRRYDKPLALAVCDIDLFKSVNDTYGHLAGDRVLQVIAKSMSARVRETDFVGRFGGEEFVFLLPETSLTDGKKTIEKIRKTVASNPFHFREKPVSITVSFGLAEFREGDAPEAVFARADKALYQAKDNGRNQCVVDMTSTDKKG